MLPPRRAAESFRDADRGASPVVAVVLLVGVTVVCAATVGGLLFGQAAALADPPPQVALSLAVTDDRISIQHRTGESLDVTELRLHVAVNGTPLADQPPVPFFSARGFAPGPTGPFNSASDPEWRVGEVASFEVAGTNRPALGVGETVTVEVYQGETLVASLEATVEARAG